MVQKGRDERSHISPATDAPLPQVDDAQKAAGHPPTEPEQAHALECVQVQKSLKSHVVTSKVTKITPIVMKVTLKVTQVMPKVMKVTKVPTNIEDVIMIPRLHPLQLGQQVDVKSCRLHWPGGLEPCLDRNHYSWKWEVQVLASRSVLTLDAHTIKAVMASTLKGHDEAAEDMQIAEAGQLAFACNQTRCLMAK